MARFHEAFTDETTRTEATEILRGLIDRVVLHPGKGGPKIESVGVIARMVELPLPKKQKRRPRGAALPDAFHRSVKLVAGTRNHLDLLLFTAVMATCSQPDDQRVGEPADLMAP